MLADFRFALRSLGRARGFTLVTVLTLALGIGSAAAIFSVADWVLFRAEKFPTDVFLIGGQTGTNPFNPVRMESMTRVYEQEKRAFTEFAKAGRSQGNVVIEGRPVATGWLGVTPNLLPMLGIKPMLGRSFLPGEDKEGSDQVIIVNYWFWKQRLGGGPDALGRKVLVGETVCTVVGVLAKDQTFPPYIYSSVLRPLTYRLDPAMPWMPQFFLFGRTAAGVTQEQAQAALRGLKVDLPAQVAQFYTDDRVVLSSLAEMNKLSRPEIYWVMVGAVGFLYAIACLNASNLMLVRMLGQRRELSVRLALGAGRSRIVRLLVAESVTLAVLAGLTGLLVANWLFPLLLSATGGPGGGARDWASWTLGWRVVGVMGLLTVVTSLAIALIPAVRVLHTDINSGLKDGGAAVGESRALGRLRGALVVLQAAFAVILLAGAGLMIRTFANFQRIDLGFEPAGIAKVFIGFPPGYPGERDWEPRLNRLKEISAELMHVPGAKAVGFGNDVLLPGYSYTSHTLAGPDGQPVKTMMMSFSIGFQEASGIRLKRGKWLDQPRGNAVLLNETLARALFPDQDPVGRFVRPLGANPGVPPDWKGWEVAGVVGDIRSTLRDAPGNMIYSPEGWAPGGFSVMIVRMGREFDVSFADALRRRLYAFDSRIVVHAVMSVSELRDNQLWVERMANSVLKVLAGIALLLTVVGMFSVLAYTVDRRMGEFGVRMALGATKRDLVALVMKRGLLLTAIGVVLGLAGTLALSKFVKTLLFGTTSNDPWVLVAVGVVLLLTSVLACAVPARRAARVDVAHLLRSE